MKTMEEIFDLIKAERVRQDAKWGQQDHPQNHIIRSQGQERIRYIKYGEKRRTDAIETTDKNAAEKTITWEDIIFEEFAEAMYEVDPAAQHHELIQLAATVVSALEALHRRFP